MFRTTRKGNPMPEGQTNTNTTPTNPAGAQAQTGPKEGNTTGPEAGRTFTQDEVNRFLAEDRRKNEAKFADYDELKAKAAKFDEAEAANKTELQKAQEAAQAAEKRAQAAESGLLRARVAAAKGVPVELLTGSTEAELEAAADALLAFKGTTPNGPPPEGHGADVHKTGDMSAADVVKAALGR